MRNSLPCLAAALLTLATLLAAPRAARAECPCSPGVQGVTPTADATAVPTNVRVTLYVDRLNQAKDVGGNAFETDSGLKLDVRDAANNKIAGATLRTTVQGITTMYRFELDPDVTLPPNQLIKAFATGTDSLVHQVTQFTTGPDKDEDPPATPMLTAFEATIDTWPEGASCLGAVNPMHRISGHGQGTADNSTPAEMLRYELIFYKVAATPPQVPTVVALGGTEFDLVQSSAKCGVGTFNTLIPGTAYCARLRAVDLAGRTATSEEVCGTVKKRTMDADGNVLSEGETDGSDSGCTALPARPKATLPAAGLLVLGLAAWAQARRQRRHQRG